MSQIKRIRIWTTLIRETAKALGYQRIGETVEIAMNCAIETAIKRGWAAINASGNVCLEVVVEQIT